MNSQVKSLVLLIAGFVATAYIVVQYGWPDELLVAGFGLTFVAAYACDSANRHRLVVAGDILVVGLLVIVANAIGVALPHINEVIIPQTVAYAVWAALIPVTG